MVSVFFCMLFFTYSYFYHGAGKWNGNSRMGLTFAIVQEHRFTIDSFHDHPVLSTGDKAYYKGHYYSDKAIGTSILGSIVYFPLHQLLRMADIYPRLPLIIYIVTVMSVRLLSALAGAFIFSICLRIRGEIVTSLTATSAIFLGTMCLPFSCLFFGHQPGAALVAIPFCMILDSRINQSRHGRPFFFIIGLSLSFAVITEFTLLLIVIPLILYFLMTFTTSGEYRLAHITAVPLAGAILPISLLIAYNWTSFGHPFSIGYQHLSDSYFNNAMSQGLMGIHLPVIRTLYYETFHFTMGIFWQSPVLILTPAGIYFMIKSGKFTGEALLISSVFVIFLLLNSSYFMWWGGWSFGPRHLIPVLPFLALPLIFLPHRFTPVLITLTIISVIHMIIVTASNPLPSDSMMTHLDTLSFFQYSTIYHECLRDLQTGSLAWNIGLKAGLKGLLSLIPLVTFITSLSIAIIWLGHLHSRLSK